MRIILTHETIGLRKLENGKKVHWKCNENLLKQIFLISGLTALPEKFVVLLADKRFCSLHCPKGNRLSAI